jgi:hypothetical protein
MHADVVFQGAKCLAMGGLCFVVGQFIITFADPRRDDALKFRRAAFIKRDQVPGWLYRFLSFSGQTEDSMPSVARLNVAAGIFGSALGIALAFYGIYELVNGFR